MLKKLSQKLIYQDAWVKFFQDEIKLPDGSFGTYAWAKRKDGVAVVVVNSEKKILLHREHRYVIDKYSWEIQGGGIDDGENVKLAAARELKEESGIVVNEKSLQKLGEFYPLHSFNTEKVTLFLARIDNDQKIDISGAETSESLDKHQFFSFAEVSRMIEEGKINDAFSANAVQLVMSRLE